MDTETSTDREARAAWSRVADPSDSRDRDLVRDFGLVEGVAEMIRLKSATGRYPVPTLEEVQQQHPDVRLIVPGDDEWPEAAETMASPPLALWIRGQADVGAALAPSLAVTGARASTSYGEFVSAEMGSEVTRAGVTVVTGGAFGIDAAATRGALAVGGAPIVFQAGGVDRPYPAAHAALLQAVLDAGGAIVSEVAPGTAPTRTRFLRRNALIGALCTGVVIVEASNRSGALHTAHAAIDALKPVGAVPGPVTSLVSAGTHDLLAKNLAYLVTDGREAAALVL